MIVMGAIGGPIRRRLAVVAAAAAVAASAAACGELTEGELTATLPLCGAPATGAPGINHVIVVVAENMSYSQVVGNTTAAPYINNTLVQQCGTATHMFGVTHYSAANYLALTAGQYPPGSPAGCSSISACDTPADNLFSQLQAKGLPWRAYMESMPTPCDPRTTVGNYKLGHNPVPFYTRIPNATCKLYDLPVADLTAQSGVFWNDLNGGTLPALSFVSPNVINQGHTNGLRDLDSFLSRFVPLVQNSTSYQSGDTVMFVTYDEGAGGTKGQNCLNQTLSMQGGQESCHIPFWVVYPYTPAKKVGGFLTHYSVTRTVEELFGLPLLAGANTATSLIAPFGLVRNPVYGAPLPPPSATPSTPSTPASATPTPSAPASASPTPPPTGTQEYVTNSGFEDGTKTGWTGLYNSQSQTAVTNATSYAGSRSLQVSSSATTAKAAGFNSKPEVIPNSPAGRALTGSAWVRASTPGLTLKMMIWELTPSGATAGYQTTSITVDDTGWHQLRNAAPYVTKASGNLVRISIYSRSLPVGQSFYTDGISLTSPA